MLLTRFTAFFPHFTPHLCEQYPKDLRFSFIITDIQAAHLSKYLLSNHAISHSLPKICVGSSHSKQKCWIRTCVASGGRCGGEVFRQIICLSRSIKTGECSSWPIFQECYFYGGAGAACAAGKLRAPAAHLTFGSCVWGYNLMRTKICPPNSPKKSLEHFVILKCLANELEPWRGCSYGTSPSVKAPRSLARWQLGMYVPPPLHFWGVELGNQTRGVSTRLGMTVWGEGQEGTGTFQEFHANLGSAHGPWMALRFWPRGLTYFQKDEGPIVNPTNDALSHMGAVSPFSPPNAPLGLRQQVTWVMICLPLPPECKFSEVCARVCIGRLMAIFPVSSECWAHRRHSINATWVDKHVTNRRH